MAGEGQNTSKEGLREYVVAYGRARITEGGAVRLLQRLTPLYLGPKAEFPPASMRSIPGYITKSRRIDSRESVRGPRA